jgi:hypothetical protein
LKDGSPYKGKLYYQGQFLPPSQVAITYYRHQGGIAQRYICDPHVQVYVIDPEAVGHQYNPLVRVYQRKGRVAEGELFWCSDETNIACLSARTISSEAYHHPKADFVWEVVWTVRVKRSTHELLQTLAAAFSSWVR